MPRLRPLVVVSAALAVATSLIPALLGDAGREGPTAAAAAPGQSRPNIVLVLTDDMRDDDLRYLPYVRRFFKQRGVRFHNSFSNNPLCCPARATLLSARHSHNHKVVWHEAPWGFGSFDDRRTLATALQQSGYRNGYVGKYLNGYGRMRSKVTGRDSTHYVPAGWDQWRATLDKNSAGVPGGTYHYFDTTMNVNGRVVRNRGQYSTSLLGQHARDVVGRLAGDQPFFLHLSTVAPHHGGPREPDDPPMLKGFTPARPGWVKGRFDKMLRKSPGTPAFGVSPERDVSDKPWPIRSLPEMGTAAHRAVRSLARQRAESLFVVDREFRRVVEHVAAAGELDDTVFIFTSDNGNFLGEHRKLTGKVLPYEPSFRVPLLMSVPGGRTGKRYGPVTTVDLAATVLELGGATSRMPTRIDGRSFLDMVIGADRPWTRPVLYESRVQAMRRGKGGALTARGLRTSRWKFISYNNGKRELYDLRRDRHELRNLVSGGRHHPVATKLGRLTRRYSRCEAAECRGRLPRKLRASRKQTRADYQRWAAAAW